MFWEAQDLVIADIDRIEVVRGPGGTLWGANAVNGVIHFIMKNASDTRGTFINIAAGTSTLGPFAVRHGGRFGAAGSYRVYGKVRSEDASLLLFRWQRRQRPHLRPGGLSHRKRSHRA